MTTKARILQVVQTLEDDVTIDQVIDQLYLLKKIETGLAQAGQDEILDHDQFMDQLLEDHGGH